MNKYVRMFGILSILCFSFYYTEKIATFMQSKDPIYESIVASKEDYTLDFVNAIIENDYITPGLKGQVVNIEKSFRNMKNYGYFSENKLIFDEVKPTISLNENLDKKISKGNSYKQAVTLIIDNDVFSQFLSEMGVPYVILTTKENVATHYHLGTKMNVDFENYDEVEKKLKLQKENNNFCFVSKENEEFCKKNKKIMIEQSLELNRSNFSKNYNKIMSGSILYLQSNLSLTNLKILLNQIYFQGYKVISLESMITESR